MRALFSLLCCLLVAQAALAQTATIPLENEPTSLGPQGDAFRTITGQLTKAAGEQRLLGSRGKDLALSPDGKLLCVAFHGGGVILDPNAVNETVFSFSFPEGVAAWHGIAWGPASDRVYLPTAKNLVWVVARNAEGKWNVEKKVVVKSGGKVDAMPLGIAIPATGEKSSSEKGLVCFSKGNTLAEIDFTAGTILREIPTGGVCPYHVVVSPDGQTAYVSNYGGRLAEPEEITLPSVGTPVLVDARGISTSGTVSCIDLKTGQATKQIAVGLHPSGMIADWSARRLYVCNANSDSVSVIHLDDHRVIAEWSVRPEASLPFGSLPSAIALSPQRDRLAVTNAGNNAVAILATNGGAIQGFIPTGRFPGAVAWNEQALFSLNTLGADGVKRGSLSRVPNFSTEQLATYTQEAKQAARVPQALRALERNSMASGVKPVPVPKKVGEPSTIKHVIYVIKENRTYDQVFGDIPRGNRDEKLCMYGYDVTPNHHALAEQFVLLDNYYCNGIVSADGHQWAVQGITSDYLEKDGQVWSRSYDFGTDPLAIANCDFLWDALLLSGGSFRNYGELDYPVVKTKGNWFEMHRRWQAGEPIEFAPRISLRGLEKYSCLDFPGWEMRIPDGYRMDVFLKEFKQFEEQGTLPDLMVVYLPQDHTSGFSKAAPTPRAHVAENDVAVGRLVEAVSHSKFWNDTAIFVNEDDPQNGTDHVDGHRSYCLVVSPWCKREATVSKFYNQTTVLHTICRILGLPPLNQMVAQSPTMEDCFAETPDPRPFKLLPTKIPFDEPNGKQASLTREQEAWCLATTAKQRFDLPDRIEDDQLNRVLWMCSFPERRYPAEFAGAHGKGLKALGLSFDTRKHLDPDDAFESPNEDDD